MNFIKKHTKLWLITGIVSLVLLLVCSIGLPIASTYETVINQALNVQTSKIIKDPNVVDEHPIYFGSDFGSENELVEYEKQLCADVMAEGAALLTNKDVGGKPALPLDDGSKVSLFSQSSVRPVYGGTGSGQVNVSAAPTFLNALKEQNIEANKTLWDFYEKGDGSSFKRQVPSTTESKTSDYAINEVPWSHYGTVVKNSFAGYGDAAIIMISRAGGEGCDLAITDGKDSKDGNYLRLNDTETDLLANVKAYKDNGTFKKIVVLLNTSNMVQLDFLDTYGIDACLWIGDIGTTGINGVARLLSGETAPSGRTVETFLKDNSATPSFANFGAYMWENLVDYKSLLGEDPEGKSTYNNAYVVYQEGIYVGYRYFETRYTDYVTQTGNPGAFDYNAGVAFPFGSGKSYTTFEYSGMQLTDKGEDIEIKVNVKNTGSLDAKHTVQIYLQAPYKAVNVEKSAVKLVGFEKTEEIAHGAAVDVAVTVPKKELTSYDADEAKTYVLDAGDYLFTVGADAHDAANNFLAYSGKTPTNTNGRMDAAGQNDLVKSWNNAAIDTETYSISEHSGVKITNRFDDTDVLKYSGMDPSLKSSFKYLSRSDWNGTYPTEHVKMKVTEQMTKDGLYLGKTSGAIGDRNNEIYKNLVEKYKKVYEEEEGAVPELPTLGASNGLGVPMLIKMKYETIGEIDAWNSLMDQITFDEMQKLVSQGFHATVTIQSINLTETKNENGPQGLTASLIGGSSAMCYTSADILAATFNRNLAGDVGRCMGEDCLYGGYSGMYAPGANIHRTAYSGRNFEYYSEDGFVSGQIAASQVRGIASKGVLVQMKHFALNDQELYRNGIATWANEQSIREVYLKAFEAAIADAGPSVSVMSSFNRLGVVWAGAHRGLMTWILDREWNVGGSNITDCSTTRDYMDGVLGLLAGTHLWDGSGNQAVAVQKNYKDDPVVVHAMKQAAFRITYSISKGNGMNGLNSTDKVVFITPWYLTLLTALIVVFAILTAALAALFIVSLVLKRRKN